MGVQKFWMGTEPKACDVCHGPYAGTMIDGRMQEGMWACMCRQCHMALGVGVGLGKGQKYQQQPDGRWLKVEG